MFLSEEKLTIQIAQVDCIKIDDVNLSEPGHDKVLEQFASDAASANEEYARLEVQVSFI